MKGLQSQAGLRFIFVTILLDALGIGFILPVLPDVIRRFNTSPEFVDLYFGYFIAVYSLMQFVASPVLGALSDRFGRRPVLLISLLGAGIDYVLMAFAPSLPWLFIGRLIAGLTGAGMTVAASYMADISNADTRSGNFGMIGAAFGFGLIVGPVIGGLLGGYGMAAPFLAAAVLNLINFLFGLLVLPESLPPSARRENFKVEFKPFASIGFLTRRSPLLALLWVYVLSTFAGLSHPSVWTLYTQKKFAWSTAQVGLSLSCVGVALAIVQGWLTRLFIPRVGERRSVLVGLSISACGFLAFSLASQGWMMYVILIFSSLAGVGGPALQSLISGGTASAKQGELQGHLIALASLAAVVGPLFYTALFSAFTATSAPFYFAGMP